MNKGRTLHAIAIIVLIALIATTEYKTLYESIVAVASPFGQQETDKAVSENSSEQSVQIQSGTQNATEDIEIGEIGENETQTENIQDKTEENNEETYVEESGAESDNDSVSGNYAGDSYTNDSYNDETVSENELAEDLEQTGGAYGTSVIPTEVDAFNTWYAGLTDGKVHITNVQDWLNFQKISQMHSLEGCVFQIDANTTPSAASGNVYAMNSVGFEGIGSEEFPFKGELTCYLSSGVSIETSAPIFKYLSTGSSISKLSIISNGATAGLAAHVTGEGTVSLSNITINGSIKNDSGAAGGLFGEIINEGATPLTISVTKENGIGVLFGVYNNIQVKVNGVYCGAIAGYISGNVKFDFDTNLYDITGIHSVNGLSSTGATGLLFGTVTGDATKQPQIVIKNSAEGAESVQINNKGQVRSGGNAGGLIGHMNYGILDASDKKVVIEGSSSGSIIDVNCSSIDADNGGVGGLIGVFENSSIVKNSKFEVKNTYIVSTVKLKGMGGFFGVISNSAIPQCDDGETMFSLSNVYVHGTSSSASNGLGGICGCYQDDTLKNNNFSDIIIRNSKLNMQMSASNKKSANGMIIGLFNGNAQSTLTISNLNIQGFMVTGHSGSGSGGVIGVSAGDGTATLTVKDSLVDSSPNLEVSNTHMPDKKYGFIIWETNSSVGGVLGTLKAGKCYIDNIQMPVLSMRSDRECGSLIGKIEGSDSKKYLSIENITLGTLYWNGDTNAEKSNGYGTKGLLIGKAGENAIVRLGGTMDFSNVIWYWTYVNYSYPALGHKGFYDLTQYVGKIAGIQEKAIIYMDTDCAYTPYEYVSNGTNDKLKVKYVDDIGNFGGVYRNGKWGEDQNLFSEDTINGTIAKNGDAYEMDSVADLMRFAIMMNSEGAFGTECFGADYTTLLSEKYVLTASQYDLSDTGVVSLQRTVGKGTSASITSLTIPTELTEMPQLFKGSFSGSNAGAPAEIILDRQVYKQNNQGLFANVGSESGESSQAVFANLKLVENFIQLQSTTNKNGYTNNSIDETGSMGGLSTYAQGNIVVENCELDVNMESRKYVDGSTEKAYYGGLFGKYTAFDQSVLTVNGITAKGDKTVRDNDHYLSQMIACVESPYNASALPQITFSNIQISGSVANTNKNDSSLDSDTYSYLGGLIAIMNENLADGSNEPSWEDDEESWHYFDKERTELVISDLTVSGFSLTNSQAANRSSGLLGFRWLDVDADLSNIVIGEDGNANTLTTYKRFGGLINEICGKMDVRKATICHTNVVSNDTENHSALFVAEGEYLYLSVTDYDVQATTVIERSENTSFDEIVGCSKRRSGKGATDYGYSESTGAVVSISTSGVEKSLLISDYHSYENGATYTVANAAIEAKIVSNNATRYYYDLPTIMTTEKAGDLSDATINSPEELMRWHLLQYSRSNLRRFFVTDTEMSNRSTILNQNYQISGTIDLNGYSYYPTSIDHKSIIGTNDATIIFYGQNIINNENDSEYRQRQPYEDEKQQHMLHSALFKDIAAVTVSNLTLSGTVSEVEYYCSGALVCGEIEGVDVEEGDEDDKLGYLYSTQAEDYTNISNITLNNLWVAKSINSWGGTKHGLMITSIVEGAKVNFDSIRMTGYDVSQSPTGDEKAARALIAVVGAYSESVVTEEDSEIQLNFVNMDIADVSDDANLTDSSSMPDLAGSTVNDMVLKDASLICYYYYYEDSSYSIYTFTKADYLTGKGINCDVNDPDNAKVSATIGSGYITMGEEISEGTEYIDENIDTKILQDMYGFKNTNYKPYVYKKREIIVNPKPGHITEGCGTYEDPYVIKTDRQLKSVYYYLKNQTAQLINWQLNPIGNDETFCDKNHDEAQVKIYGKDIEGFPTREQLSQAYYLISPEADSEGNRVIDLTSCEDFVGLGSLNEPFVGVIVGNKEGDSLPVIKLPGYVNSDQDVDSFGLVRYAKGCVVKDLAIQLGTTKTVSSVDTTYYASVKGAGAGVFGNVCGGDNIIDNVTVKGTLQASAPGEGSVYSSAAIGGYAGCVDLGTLIIRNISAESLLAFSITDSTNQSVVANGSYMWTGGIIGRVKDGTVIYEGLADGNTSIVKSGTTGFAYANTQGLEPSPNYGIVNASYLKNAVSCGNVKIQTDTNGSMLTIQADNAGQLLLTAMALNSGTLTYVGDTEAELQYRNGYGADSRCRNGSYETVGTVTDATVGDYVDAVTYDNLNGRQPVDAAFFAPYLLEYFTVSTPSGVTMPTILLGSSTSLAYNDPATCSRYISMPANNVTLVLAENTNYDMTVFEGSFRGIGGGYYKENNTFKGNVEGNNSTVKLSYLSNASLAIDNIGLFNTVVVDAQTDGCYMEDLTITGTLLNADVAANITTLTTELLTGDSVSGKSAAGLIGRLEIESDLVAANFTANKYNYSFTNIQINNMNVETQEYAGGLIGRIVSTPEGGVNSTYGNALYFENCNVGQTTQGEAEDTYNVTVKGRADVGGIIASYQDPINVVFINCTAQSVDLQSRGMHLYQVKSSGDKETLLDRKVYASAGGFIGRGVGNGKTITIEGGSYNKISLKAKGHMGGVIGETESTLLVNSSKTENFTGNKLVFSGLGTYSETYITNDALIDTTLLSNGSYDTNAACYNRTKYLGSFGGFVGFVSGNKSGLYNITVTNIQGTIPTGRKDQTFMGGLVGRMYQAGVDGYTIEGCTVGSEDTTFSLKAEGYYNDTIRVSTGGLVGNIECAAMTHITNCSVIGNKDGSSTLQGTDTVGGMNARVKTYINSGGLRNNVYYESCIVKNLSLNSYVRVGGVEGSRVETVGIEIYSRFHNVTVSDCVLFNMDQISVAKEEDNNVASGGLQAYSQGHTIVVSCTVENLKMKGKTTYAAGGLLGRCSGNYAWIRTADTTVKDCTIVGACAGGIAGRIDKKKSTAIMTCLSEITVSHNKIISHYHEDEDAVQYVGGIYGYWSTAYDFIMGENIQISDNLIAALPITLQHRAAKINIGGMIGSTMNQSKIKSPYLKNNIVTMLDKDTLSTKVPADSGLEDYLISTSFGIWNNTGEVDTTGVESVEPRLYNSVGNYYKEYCELTTENEINQYLAYVGLLFGCDNDKAAWITDVKVAYNEELRIYRPAADVSRNIRPSWDYNIIYGEYEDSDYKEGQTDVDNQNIAQALELGDSYYQFGDLQKIWSDYKAETDKKYAYRLAINYQGTGYTKNTKITIEEVLSGTYYDEDEGYRSIYTNESGVVIPMLVYDNNASLDEMINTAINVLTNNGGCLRETNKNQFASVTPMKMVVENGVVRKATEADSANYSIEPSISVSNGNYTSLACNVNSTGYDEQKDSKNGTFTVLKIDYKWSYPNGNNTLTYDNINWYKYTGEQTPTMTLYIPVYLEKVLEYQTHITGVQGAEYYLNNLLENGKESIQTLRDTYTAYVEYDYNDAYNKYNSALKKEISYKHTGTGADVNIPKGTKFVLIDISDNGHAYYYNVESDTTAVEFSGFKDSNNNAYTEKVISSLSEDSMDKTLYKKHEDETNKSMPSNKYVLQQYILLVDSSEVTDAVTNYAYKLVVQPDTNDTDTANLIRRSIKKDCPQNCELAITEYQGISGAFNEENTTLIGEISPEENVTINLEYDITAPGEYWTYLTANQGSNLSQYLDVAIYLQKDGNRVALPSGTQVTFNKGTDKQAVGVMQGNTILYQYKDAGLTYDLNKLTGNIRLSGTIDLDFSSADFTGFDNGEYTVIFDLLKTKDANFPMGGEVLDTFATSVQSKVEKNLGFVLETTDLLALGMNGYLPEESDSGVVNCTMKIDFSDYLNVLGLPSKEMTEMSNKYFTVQFEIQKKVKADDGSLSYETYNGDLVKVYFGESENALGSKVDASKVVYKFTEDFMKDGYSADGNKEKSVVSFPYTVVADVDGLLETYDNITNYRVIAKLYLTDNMPSGTKAEKDSSSPSGCYIYISPSVNMSDAAESMKDYFVFTVAKIKTDLDITN